ncbi:MAG: TolC family protein [Aquirufa sp.]
MKNSTFLFLLIGQICIAQEKVLNPESFLKIVQTYHPVSQKASIGIRKSEAEILKARGAFDPILSHYSAKKTLDSKNYYEYHSPELSIPTWYGIELSAGIENLQGTRIDPSRTLGQTSYIGISVPLAKNLVIDKRRAALAQAKIMNKMAFEEQRNTINTLIYEAMEAYFMWAKSYTVLNIVKQNLDISLKRKNYVLRSVELGDRPAIDTLEASTQVQYFENLYQNKWLDFQNNTLSLSVYLWSENNTPMELDLDVRPNERWTDFSLLADFDLDKNSLLEKAYANHPELKSYQYKIEALQVDRKLKFQSLLPKLDLTYNQLSKGGPTLYTSNLLDNNFQYGLKVEIPLRFSQGRGEYAQAKLKIQEENLNLAQKKQGIELKIHAYFNQFQSLKKQINTQENALKNYQALVKAEESKFEQGESSLFLINSRETKAMEAAEKLIDLKSYLFKSIYALQSSAGLLI